MANRNTVGMLQLISGLTKGIGAGLEARKERALADRKLAIDEKEIELRERDLKRKEDFTKGYMERRDRDLDIKQQRANQQQNATSGKAGKDATKSLTDITTKMTSVEDQISETTASIRKAKQALGDLDPEKDKEEYSIYSDELRQHEQALSDLAVAKDSLREELDKQRGRVKAPGGAMKAAVGAGMAPSAGAKLQPMQSKVMSLVDTAGSPEDLESILSQADAHFPEGSAARKALKEKAKAKMKQFKYPEPTPRSS